MAQGVENCFVVGISQYIRSVTQKFMELAGLSIGTFVVKVRLGSFDVDTHLRICLHVEPFLTSCRYWLSVLDHDESPHIVFG